jgi:sugar lactone lactonase YvrE
MMKPYPVKHLFYTALFLFVMACFFTSCFKTGIKPVQKFPTSSKTADSIAAADTLPSFYSPTGLALDAAGNIYVADYGNNLIRKITPAGIVSTFAGSGVQGSVNATGLLASFNQPKGVAVDASGNVYVADSGSSLIRKITSAGVVTTFAGTDSTFFSPSGIAVDAANNVYVADTGNDLIRKITPAGTVSILAGTPSTGVSNSVFDNPTGLAVDATGNVFVANYLDNVISEINPAGIVTTFAGSGQQGANNGPDTAATFYFPNNVAVDANSNVYVADGVNNLIRKITPAGVVSTLAGSGAAGAADSTGIAASFNGPTGVAVDAVGNVYVADSNNNLIRKITPAGVVSTIAGNGEAGSRNGKAVAYHNSKVLSNPANNLLKIFAVKKRSGVQ